MKKTPRFIAGVLLVSALLSGCGSTAAALATDPITSMSTSSGGRPAIRIDASYLLNTEDTVAQTVPQEIASNGTLWAKAVWKQQDADPASRQPVYYGDHIIATGYLLGVFGSYEGERPVYEELAKKRN